MKNSRSVSKPPKYSLVQNNDGSKTLFIDRKVTDRALYKPTTSFIF